MPVNVRISRDTIVATAAELSDKEGFESLTLARVAARLGVRSQSLYGHIDGIDSLRRELQLRYNQLSADKVRRAAVGLAGRDAIMAIARELVDFELEHPGLAAAAARPPGDDPELWAAIADTTEPLLIVLRSYGLVGDDSFITRRGS